MYTEFNNLPDTARIWVYQSIKRLDEEAQGRIHQALKPFASNWQAHGADLEASYCIVKDHFVIIGVNELVHQPTGCAIDSSVSIMKQLSADLNIDFFNRTHQGFLIGEQVQFESLKNIRSGKFNLEITTETLMFNNLISTKGLIDTEWLTEAGNSWLAKYFQPQTT